MHMLNRKDLNSAELETVKFPKKSDDGCDRQRRSANKRWSNGVCQRIGFIRDSKASRGDPLRDLPEWLEEFMVNLVDERVPAYRDAAASSSRASAPEPRGKVVSGKHGREQGLLAENTLVYPYLEQTILETL